MKQISETVCYVIKLNERNIKRRARKKNKKRQR